MGEVKKKKEKHILDWTDLERVVLVAQLLFNLKILTINFSEPPFTFDACKYRIP